MKLFLTANWRYLAMLNYVVDPALVEPLVPVGTEIDYENGETFVSIVGFLFLDTPVLGLPILLHRDFEEVNLRFYVRRKSADTWRRGLVFVRELVPRRAIALVARAFYGERYFALPMKHRIEHVDAKLSVEHYWGYTCVRGGCSEYRVEHPRWKIWNAASFEFTGDVASLYGEQFVQTLSATPRSA